MEPMSPQQYPDQGGQGMPPMTRSSSKKQSKRGRKKRKDHTRKDFKIPLIAAIILAVFAGLILFATLGSGEQAPDTYVVRAASDISAYKVLTPGVVEAVPMDLATLVPEGVDPASMIVTGPSAEEAIAALGIDEGIVLRYPVVPGGVLYLNNLTLASTAKAEYNLQPGDRIVAVEALPGEAAGGAIVPGEFVDVIAVNLNYEVATTVLKKVPVLYVDLSQNALEGVYSSQLQEPSKDVSDLLPADPYPGIYTLAVPEAYADTLALLQESSILVLAGRVDSDDTPIPLDADGLQPRNPTISILETFCDPELLPEPNVDGGVAVGSEDQGVVTTSDVLVLPDTCIAELLKQKSDILSSTEDLLVTTPDSLVTELPGTGSETVAP